MRRSVSVACSLLVASGGLVSHGLVATEREAAPAAAQTAVQSSAAKHRPKIKARFIPFPDSRRRQTARYSARHYGARSWRLDPRVIVEHYTGTNSLSSVMSTFASNSPDPELRELPGTCAHFVIDRDGAIHQLVRLDTRCRHTVGLNHVALGIEHVGTSDGQVMSNKRQRRSSLAMTAWLMGRFGIGLGNVIGHNESLRSPFHREAYAQWRCQTHGDFGNQTMRNYRRHLRLIAKRRGLDTRKPNWTAGDC